ncbi:hypothetical protein GW17_00000335 [Ensete ventricosum]|nr:hypothetical protein GW17_00000335 [Ensete ventricosum]
MSDIAQLQFLGLGSPRDWLGSSEMFSAKSPLTMGYSGDIYTCGADGGRTEMFNGRNAFGRPTGTALHGPLPLLILGVSFDIYRLSVRFTESSTLRKSPPTIAEVAADVAREPWGADVVVELM